MHDRRRQNRVDKRRGEVEQGVTRKDEQKNSKWSAFLALLYTRLPTLRPPPPASPLLLVCNTSPRRDWSYGPLVNLLSCHSSNIEEGRLAEFC